MSLKSIRTLLPWQIHFKKVNKFSYQISDCSIGLTLAETKMSNILNLNQLFHRNKKRIKDLGEVFTPESYVEDMLDLLSKDKREIWSDEQLTFFEPCCGHGNIVISIYKRRLEAIYKKSLAEFNEKAPYYTIANAINTLWAIDIDRKNVENCRTRVLAVSLDFLREKIGSKSDSILFTKKKDFIAHLISAIKWHIDENETLSSLSSEKEARYNAQKTKSGEKWFSQNGHHELIFSLTWVDFFKQCERKGTIPLNYERVLRFIDNISSGRGRGFEDLAFAKDIFNQEKSTFPKTASNFI